MPAAVNPRDAMNNLGTRRISGAKCRIRQRRERSGSAAMLFRCRDSRVHSWFSTEFQGLGHLRSEPKTQDAKPKTASRAQPGLQDPWSPPLKIRIIRLIRGPRPLRPEPAAPDVVKSMPHERLAHSQ
jgi:hypothetical protein